MAPEAEGERVGDHRCVCSVVTDSLWNLEIQSTGHLPAGAVMNDTGNGCCAPLFLVDSGQIVPISSMTAGVAASLLYAGSIAGVSAAQIPAISASKPRSISERERVLACSFRSRQSVSPAPRWSHAGPGRPTASSSGPAASRHGACRHRKRCSSSRDVSRFPSRRCGDAVVG